MKKGLINRLLTGGAIFVVLAAAVFGGAISDRMFGYRVLDKIFPGKSAPSEGETKKLILNEESTVIEVVEKVSPSVVTVRLNKTQSSRSLDAFDPFFDPFGLFRYPAEEEEVQQDIGSGFVIDKNGLVVTNRHVVGETNAKYQVIAYNKKVYDVKKIYRDQANDLAILKIDSTDLDPIILGDSDRLKVGQLVIAIGTSLGEFPNSVTTGVISGLGRGITAGSPFEGYVEKLDNVIQTDAAINPGNSGGPLLNSSGQAIGINVAIAAEGENIGFAIPINVVKEMIENFNKTGRFDRAFLGVRYKMIDQDLSIKSEVPQGAYIVEVISGAPAEKAGIKLRDIITKLDGQPVTEEKGGLAGLINQKKIGDRVTLEVWRKGEKLTIEVTLEGQSE